MKEQIDLHGMKWSPKRRLNRGAASTGTTPESFSFGRGVRGLLRRGEDGQALVEMALTLPALFAVLTAIFAFAIAFSNEITLTNAVGAAGQHLTVIRLTTADPCADTMATIQKAAPNLKPSSINLSLNLNGTIENGATCPGGAALLAAAAYAGNPVTVTATYPFALPIMSYASNPGWVLTATVTEYAY